MNIPNRASDAGPEPRRFDANDTVYECAGCGIQVTRRESYCCSGSDDCWNRLCESCKVQCVPCGLPVCPTHRTDVSGEITCELCLAVAIEEGAAELEEAR